MFQATGFTRGLFSGPAASQPVRPSVVGGVVCPFPARQEVWGFDALGFSKLQGLPASFWEGGVLSKPALVESALPAVASTFPYGGGGRQGPAERCEAIHSLPGLPALLPAEGSLYFSTTHVFIYIRHFCYGYNFYFIVGSRHRCFMLFSDLSCF